jgi:ABC-2 type transport system permease protein
MLRLINAELFKLRKRAMTSILLFVLVGILIIIYLILLAVSNANLPIPRADEGMPRIVNLLGLPVAIPLAFMFLAGLGSILAVILVASSMGNEYNWRTIRTLLTSSESRFKLLCAKLISAILLILLGMVIGVVTGFIMSLITTAIGGYKFDFGFATGSYMWDQFLQFWRTFYVMLPYIFLGFLLSIVGRSAMPGIALGIAILFFEPVITGLMNLAGGWISEIPAYLLGENVNAITALADLPSGFGGGFGFRAIGEMPSITHATIVLGVYSVVSLVLAFYLFRKRDVTS